MRLLILLTYIFLFGKAKAQTTAEDFVNEIDTAVVKKSKTKYYLSQIQSNYLLVKRLNPYLESDLKKVLPDSVVNLFLNKIDEKKEFKSWNSGIIESAILVDEKKIDTLIGNVLVAHLSQDTKQSINKKRKLLRTRMKRVYFFSEPLFDPDNKYALVLLGYVCGNACGEQCLYIFKLENGIWKRILRCSCSLS